MPAPTAQQGPYQQIHHHSAALIGRRALGPVQARTPRPVRLSDGRLPVDLATSPSDGARCFQLRGLLKLPSRPFAQLGCADAPNQLAVVATTRGTACTPSKQPRTAISAAPAARS